MIGDRAPCRGLEPPMGLEHQVRSRSVRLSVKKVSIPPVCPSVSYKDQHSVYLSVCQLQIEIDAITQPSAGPRISGA